ncbi:MAG: amidase [Magnetococcales bacterium]|nr:amidase [Magnetococcales bacterium]MBF0148977.1 amidase [Magnetococcales bacterium]MBF0603043.1 amidase [Magnetococcales bacterium]
MEPSEVWMLGGKEIAARVRMGRLRPVDAVQAFLGRCREVEPIIKAWETLDPDYALEQAVTLERQWNTGRSRGRMAGVPMGVKDVINTRVLPTKMGSCIWETHKAGNDARIVAHACWEDAIVFGKTVTAEFAVHEPGPTSNPHCLTCTPGTSSSGSAAAVAAGMVPVALGTQTAGSLIRPASFCGVYAFKPTFGWLPRTGVLKTTDTLDQIGFYSRYPEDLREMFEVMRVRGRDHILKDENLAKHPEKERWKVALVQSHVTKEAPDYALKALEEFARTLAADPRVTLVELDLPREFDRAHDIHGRIYDSDLSYYFRREMAESPERLSPILREIIERGMELPPADYRVALQEQTELNHALERFFLEQGVDVGLMLSSNGVAPEGREESPIRDACLICTMCGVPTINIPAFRGPKDLPFGIQVASHKYGDNVLLGFIEYLRRTEVIPVASIPKIQ